MSLSLQPFADIGVADPGGEQADGDGDHENIHHGKCSVLRLDVAALGVAGFRAGTADQQDHWNQWPHPPVFGGGEVPLEA